MDPNERIESALEELSQVCSNIQYTTRAMYVLHQDGLASDIADWSTIINSAICDIREARTAILDKRLNDAKEHSAAILQGILCGSIVKPVTPEVKP